MEFSERCWPKDYDFFRHLIIDICSVLILPKTQKCMQKISKQLTTFIDHRQKGESLWSKKLEKTSVIKFNKKEFWGSLKLNLEACF